MILIRYARRWAIWNEVKKEKSIEGKANIAYDFAQEKGECK